MSFSCSVLRNRFLLLLVLMLFSSCLSEQDIDGPSENNINKVEISSENPTPSSSSTEIVIIKESTTAISNVLQQQSSQKLVCPGKETRVPFFSLSCRSTQECSFLGGSLLCCRGRCIRGVKPPKPEPSHAPLFGVIERTCPVDRMPELLAIQECIVDDDCGPRICCPERSIPGGQLKSYCRNAAPNFSKMPVVKQFLSPLRTFASYLQCTAPPPPFLDLFPKPCESVLDCFPSLCCQEYGKKVCRPPKKSLLSLVATAAQRIGTSSIAKTFIERISK